MTKKRVYELAKEMGLGTRELVRILEILGMTVKSHMSTVEPGVVEKVTEYLKQRKTPSKPSSEARPTTAPGRSEKRPSVGQSSPEARQRSPQVSAPAAGAPTPPAPPSKAPAAPLEKVSAAPARAASGPPGREGEKRKEGKPLRLAAHSYLPDLEEEEEPRPRPKRRKKGKPLREARKPPTAPAKKVTLEGSLTVQELANKMGRPASEVIKKLIGLGIMAGLNDELDQDTATLVAGEFGVEVRIRSERSATEIEEPEDNPAALQERPPVVTVMGHVDHGKTSLLDAIRHTNVTAQEAGGITQHIGAYQVEINGRKITFIDTPGHEAFTTMRARGAQVTDIAVLVVAADDGVMPQTIEAINHARAAGVPIVVAINKMDKPDANPDRVKQQLAEQGLVPEEWGGETICVPVSALKRQGLEELLEMILLVADLQGLTADPTRPAKGVVLESELDRGRGPVATVLVQKGTLRVGDNFVVGASYGRVRAMLDDQGRPVKEAGPSMPVRVLGLEEVPEAGDVLLVVTDEKKAREVAEARQAERRRTVAQERPVTLEELFRQAGAKEAKELNVIVKADVHGSVEAVRHALERLGNEEVKLRVIHSGVGAISESDVMLASASRAMIVGFNVRPEPGARRAAEEEKVEVRLYRIIYELLEDMKSVLSGMLEPELREVELGRAEVRATFHVPKVGVVAGCYVVEGKVARNALVRLVRDGKVVYQGRVSSLKRFKDDVREVVQGYECGIGLENFNDVKVGDLIEAYVQEKVRRQL
ncbi:MAG: translation initiation factor IF-2 [Moorellales bacterium]